jgi:hypothetical protein
MKSPFIARGFIAFLALTTIGTGAAYFLERHEATLKEASISSMQSTMQSNQITVVKMRKELEDSHTSSSPAVPTSPQQSDLLRELQTAAGKSQVSLQSTSFALQDASNGNQSGTQQGNSTQAQSAVVTTVEALGNRTAILNFVHVLQTEQRYVQVQSMQITSGTDAAHANVMLQLSFPFQK